MSDKVKSEELIKDIVSNASKQAKHYQRGYFTGVFDGFHKGHLRTIQAASKVCDKLIVGVSTDELVKSYKHKTPVVPFQERLEIVDNIKGVQTAIPQTDLYNKVEVCKTYGCDVIITSEEYIRENYTEEEIANLSQKELDGLDRWNEIRQEAAENGIDVIAIPRTQGVSSTQYKVAGAEAIGYQKPAGQMLYSEGDEFCAQEDTFCL